MVPNQGGQSRSHTQAARSLGLASGLPSWSVLGGLGEVRKSASTPVVLIPGLFCPLGDPGLSRLSGGGKPGLRARPRMHQRAPTPQLRILQAYWSHTGTKKPGFTPCALMDMVHHWGTSPLPPRSSMARIHDGVLFPHVLCCGGSPSSATLP